MSKAPNLLARSLLVTGGLVFLAVVRFGFTPRSGLANQSILTDLIVTAVGIALAGLLGGLLVHWGWPRTRSRLAGALLAGGAAVGFLVAGSLATGIWSRMTPGLAVAAVTIVGVIVGVPFGAWHWPPRGSGRLSSSDLIVGREPRSNGR